MEYSTSPPQDESFYRPRDYVINLKNKLIEMINYIY